MHLAAASPPARKPEPTIALINVVFLMLIFFLIAGTVAPPLDKELTLVRTDDLQGREPPDALVIHADGAASWRGEPVDPSEAIARLQPPADGETAAIRIVPDRDLPALRLIEIADELRRGGAGKVFIVTERGLE